MNIEVIGSIGNRIKFMRISKNKSMSDVARNLNVSPQTVSSWERGSKTPTIDNLKKLERVLGIGVLTEEFVNEEVSRNE